MTSLVQSTVKNTTMFKLVVNICIIKLKSVYWYYESRRRAYLDSKPERTEKKAENDKVTQRQRTVSTLQLNCYIVLTTSLLITSMHANYNIFVIIVL